MANSEKTAKDAQAAKRNDSHEVQKSTKAATGNPKPEARIANSE